MDTSIDLPTLKLRLAEAELAAHNLAIGKATQSLTYEGKSVTYTQASSAKLAAYIADLKGKIGALEGRPTRLAPIHMSF